MEQINAELADVLTPLVCQDRHPLCLRPTQSSFKKEGCCPGDRSGTVPIGQRELRNYGVRNIRCLSSCVHVNVLVHLVELVYVE